MTALAASGTDGAMKAANVAMPWWRDRSTMIVLSVLGLGLAALFFRWGWKQGQFAVKNFADWGHTLVIPAISAYLVWRVAGVLAKTKPVVFWPGAAPFLLGIVCYFYFVVAVPNHMLQGLAIVLAIGGLSLWMLGPAVLRHLFLPIAYLFFAIRLSQKVMQDLTWELQLMATAGGEFALLVVGSLLGFDVMRDGNVLTVTSESGAVHPLNVAEACAGMRMVVAFFALGAVVALVGCKHWWQRVVLMMLAAPVAVVLNIARVSVLGLLSLADADLASGEAHTLIGTLLLVPGLGLFLLIVWVLNRTVIEGATPPAKGAPA